MKPTTSSAVMTDHVPDIRELYRHRPEVREMVDLGKKITERLDASELGVVAQAKLEAQRYIGKRGMSHKRILARHYEFKETGDWRVFVPKWLLKCDDGSELSATLIEFWKGLCQSNQRKCKPAWRRLLSMYYSGEEIPGFGTWRTYWSARGMNIASDTKCPQDIPDSWSYRNFMRFKPDKAELSLARLGIAPTRSLLSHVIGTREKMRPLEYLAFDDVELDFLVVVPGVERPCKLRALVVKDVATDMLLRFVTRPALIREDGVKDGLKLKDMKRLILELLMNFGYPTDYVSHWVIERGTATILPGDIAALHQISGGMIDASPTSMISGKVLIGGYADDPVGNSWGKAWIESGFNLLHNELAFVPGQKGKRYDLAPAELDARKKDAMSLIRAGKSLPTDLRILLRLPFPDIYTAEHQIRDAMMRINLMRDHKCEGFDQVIEWRLADGDPWKPYEKLLELPPVMMEHVLTNRRVETRMERWAKLIRGVAVQKLPDEVAPRWMDDHRLVRVEKYQIQFKHEGKTLVYFDRDSALLVEGQEYLAYINPFDLDFVYLTDTSATQDEPGAYRGRLPLVHAVTRGDQEALARRFADVRHVLNTTLARTRGRHMPDAEQAIAAMEDNLILFQNNPSVPLVEGITQAVADTAGERRQSAKRQAAASKLDASDLLGISDTPDSEEFQNPESKIQNSLDPSDLL